MRLTADIPLSPAQTHYFRTNPLSAAAVILRAQRVADRSRLTIQVVGSDHSVLATVEPTGSAPRPPAADLSPEACGIVMMSPADVEAELRYADERLAHPYEHKQPVIGRGLA